MAKSGNKTKNNFKEISADELKKKLETLRDKVRVIRFKAEGSRPKNVKELLSLRKEIARILTELNRKK